MDKSEKSDTVTVVLVITAIMLIVIALYAVIYSGMMREDNRHKARIIVQPSRPASEGMEETAPGLMTYKHVVPLEAFLVSEEFARSAVTNCYVRHGGKLYSVARVAEATGEKYNIGIFVAGSRVKYLYDFGTNGYVVAMGDFDPLVLSVSSGDELVEYNGETLTLHPVELVGYAIPVMEHAHNVPRVTMKLPDGDATWLDADEARTLRVTNAAGERVYQWYDLRYGEVYNVAWQKAGAAEQASLYAVCECYQANFSDKYRINLSQYRHVTEDGVNIYDLSGIQNGKYLVVGLSSYGIIDIDF